MINISFLFCTVQIKRNTYTHIHTYIYKHNTHSIHNGYLYFNICIDGQFWTNIEPGGNRVQSQTLNYFEYIFMQFCKYNTFILFQVEKKLFWIYFRFHKSCLVDISIDMVMIILLIPNAYLA